MMIGKNSRYTCIGLMSGTSMDGIDAALIRTDGIDDISLGPFLTYPYPEAFRRRLRTCLSGQSSDQDQSEIIKNIEIDLTNHHIYTVERLLESVRYPFEDVDFIGFHGHTIDHQPHLGYSWQIGDATALAYGTGIPVIARFRDADIAAGGQGAPLVPLFHQALGQTLERPLAILNIGGVANVTWLGHNDDICAFDTGPGNALIDDWMSSYTAFGYDHNGSLARQGSIHELSLKELMNHPFFECPVPKSLDRNRFDTSCLGSLTAMDGAATLTAFTVEGVYAALRWLPERPCRWLVTGGGRYNRTLMSWLENRLETVVEAVEAVGWHGDALEAQAFGFLAVRSVRGLPLTLPSTTGVSRPISGGQQFDPPSQCHAPKS